MKKLYQPFSIQFFVLFFAVLIPVASAQTFEVTQTDDPTPDGCNSGTDCSLREAIIAANDAASGTAVIQLQGGQTYTLSRVNSDTSTDSDATTADEESGSLKILNNDAAVRIEAVGSGLATIDANEIDRVFILYPGTDVEIDEIEITGGKPNGSSTAGGIMVIKNENLVITNSTITGNSAGDGNSYGGGIWIEGSAVTITESIISNNAAGFQGGGLRIIRYNEDDGTVNSDVTIQNSKIINNDGGDYGGGIHSERADLTITESTISENQASFVGGGIYISTLTSMDRNITIDRSTVDGNFGGLSGGLDIGGGEVLIINSTISGNEADNFNGAGGIYVGNFSDPVVDIVNTTITNNTSGTIGGVINGTGGGVINFSNSIVANQASFAEDCSGTMSSNGYNLESEETCGFTATGDLQNSDPLLGPLQDNGGPVFTHAITGPLSPAVNAGSNALYTSEGGGDLANDSDASGNDRVYDFSGGGIIDIGSFELQQDANFDGCPVTHEDKILFVKNGESGTGANWADALGELRDALALFEDETCTTDDVEEIWVTAGTYLPTDDSGDREATFLMPGVNIYGGFEGDETNRNQRDGQSNVSILSGDINDDDNLSGNSYHVVTSMDEESGVLFDFTITGGNANGTAPHDKGGGLYASNGGISMADVLFENNYAETAGGGAYVIETVNRIGAQHPGFTRTTFKNNESGEDGGGLFLEDAKSRLTVVTFEDNTASRYGGAIFMNQSEPVLKNVIFTNNHANSQGGAIGTNYSSPELFNVLMTQNTARFNGGAVDHAFTGTLGLYNVTMYGNEAEETASQYSGNGGGIYNRNGAELYIQNSIIWGNSAALAGNEIWNAGPSSAEVSYSLYGNEEGDIVEGGGFTATNSLTSDPVFIDPGNDDFTLQSTSPAINTGDPATDMSDFKLFGPDEIDLAENPRVYNGDVDIIDMGAYEFQGNVAPPSSCPATGGILFVKKGESGTGSGWDDALGELRDIYALFDSEDCTTDDVDEIWVAAGTYLPTDNTSDRTASFSIINDVDIFGGFEGINSETSLEDRDWETNVTILSGDIDNDSALDDNSYHVVQALESGEETILDGFTITDGNADFNDGNDNNHGGGLYVNNGTLTVKNVVFDDNYAENNGGGAFVKNSEGQPLFMNVTFTNNESGRGGGLATDDSSPIIEGSIFTANTADWGGGAEFSGTVDGAEDGVLITNSGFTENTGNTAGGAVSTLQSDVSIINSVIRGNESTSGAGSGGGINNQESEMVLRNVLISGNSSANVGGGISFDGTDAALLINSTVTGNEAQGFGGGVQIINSSPAVQNSIVWNNNSIDQNFERADNFSLGAGDPVISYSLIQGCKPGGTWDEFCGTDGGDNLSDEDPLFDTGINPGDSPTANGDFSLTSASPVINLGNNTLYTDSGGDIDNDLDLAEEPRLFDGTTDVIDLGAYEFQADPGEPEFAPFITTWNTDNEGPSNDNQITIPTTGTGFNYDIYWEEVGNASNNGNLNGQTGSATITFPSAGTYRVEISGDFPRIFFNNTGDKLKLLTIEQWGDVVWDDMGFAFQGAANLEVNAADAPDLRLVEFMTSMFEDATSLSNSDFSNWITTNVTGMKWMFAGATSFNGDITTWDVTNVTDMTSMFEGATAFNQDISGWQTDSLEDIFGMFLQATSFNSDVSGWNTSGITDMDLVFAGAESFNRNLANWDVSGVTTMQDMLSLSGLSETNYDNTLIGWEAQTVQNNVTLGASGLQFCDAAEERQGLIDDHSWTINGDSEGCGFAPFITTWKTDNTGDSDDQTISIPMVGNGYDFNVDWGDGNDEDYSFNSGVGVPHHLEHTYSEAGEYVVKITGDFPQIIVSGEGDELKIISVDQWGDIVWGSMAGAFSGASNMTMSATDRPDLSNVTNMNGMFSRVKEIKGDITNWDVSNVQKMENLFVQVSNFNQDIGGWDVSNVESMNFMFNNANSFNQDIGDWNTESVKSMGGMFFDATAFNQDISRWDTENVETMRGMFLNAINFNQDIGGWKTGNVGNMRDMFNGAESFDQDLGNWDVTGIAVSKVSKGMESMLDGSGLSTENYDNTLIGWAAQAVQSEITLGAEGLTYCEGETARQSLIDDDNWTITGDTLTESCGEFRPFITTWRTDNDGESNDDQITIPTEGSGYDYDVYWESTTDSSINGTETDNTGDLTITFPSAGTYSVEITGDFPRIYINNEGDREKILTIEQWGDITWSSFSYAFRGASNLTYNATDTPDLSAVTDMSGMFSLAPSFNGNLDGWNVSNVTDMSSLFSEAISFNGDLSGWDVSNVTDMAFMFSNASSFNGDLSNWTVSNVTTMRNMFAGATSFNGDLSKWDVSSVINMRRMFVSASSFNGDLSEWDVSSVGGMFAMFGEASSFNSDLSGWDVSNVASMKFMFSGATSFNQDIGSWDISGIEVSEFDAVDVGMQGMFDNSGLSTENYDNTLIGWESKSVPNDVELGADGLTYCNGESARQALIDDHSWTITDDGLAGGCTSPEGDNQRILVSNAEDYEFSKSDFGVSNNNYFIKIETLPDEGTLKLDGSAVNLDDEISIQDINNDEFTWDMPNGEYGYNFTSFQFRIVDDSENQSENPYTMTIDLGSALVELSGSQGWRFMSNPSDGDSYSGLFSGITVQTDAPSSQTLYELDQENYEWDPVGSTGDEPGVGTPFIVYVLEEDLPETIESGGNWDDLDGGYSYSGLDYDAAEDEPNPDDFYLLGNPHPIALDFCQFVGEDISTSAYFWNPEANGGNGDYVNQNCAAPEDVLIAPFQAFWIRTTGASPALDIPEEAYLGDTEEGYFKDIADMDGDNDNDEPSDRSKRSDGLTDGYVVTLNVTGENGLFTNRAQILFADEATAGLDRFDAPKLSAEGLASQWLSFHSLDENQRTYAFQSMPASHLNNKKVRISLDVQTTESGRFTLDWNLPEPHLFNGSYFLRDNQTGEVIELQKGASYSFEVEPDEAVKAYVHEKETLNLKPGNLDLSTEVDSRFELLITQAAVDGMTELGAVPEKFELAQNYPNPFNPTTVISYQLPVNSQVRLEVYDMIGRRVAELVNGQIAAGRHTVNFDASNLSSGIYLYRLVAGSTIMTKKLTVVK